MDFIPAKVIVPIFKAVLSVAVPEALLFFMYIPAAFSPSRLMFPLFETVIFPCPARTVSSASLKLS